MWDLFILARFRAYLVTDKATSNRPHFLLLCEILIPCTVIDRLQFSHIKLILNFSNVDVTEIFMLWCFAEELLPLINE